MTVKEWKEQNPDTAFTMIWAADSLGGFGKKGWSVYGNADSCEVIRVDEPHQNGNPWSMKQLHVWLTSLWGPCPTEE